MNLAPNSVSGRVVNIFSSLSPSGVVAVSSANRTSKPSERPIQLRCISRTLSGQRARTPAAAVDHLLVGEHGHIDRVPIDLAMLALGQPGAQEVVEQLLLVLV